MNTKNEKNVAEKISAYIDDDLNVDEIELLIGANGSLEQTDSRFSTATRYHMVGDALRGELSDVSMIDVSSQVREALLNETMVEVESSRSVKKPSLPESRFDFFAWLESFARPLTGMAVAASVAMLMVVTVVQTKSPEDGQQLATSPASVPDTLIANKRPTENSYSKQQQVAEFDAYLTEHAEFAAQDTLQGRIPYVRAVSYEAE